MVGVTNDITSDISELLCSSYVLYALQLLAEVSNLHFEENICN